MTNRFEICVGFVLAHETEYNHDGSVKVERDPHDPGGTTKFGIDQRSHPHIDVARLSLEEATEIYRAGEWTKCRCAEMKAPWDLAILDAAVNIGAGTVAKMLQTAVGAKVDGFIGPKTIAAVKAADESDLRVFLDLRESYYRTRPDSLRMHYLHGWLNRLADVRAAVQPISARVVHGGVAAT